MPAPGVALHRGDGAQRRHDRRGKGLAGPQLGVRGAVLSCAHHGSSGDSAGEEGAKSARRQRRPPHALPLGMDDRRSARALDRYPGLDALPCQRAQTRHSLPIGVGLHSTAVLPGSRPPPPPGPRQLDAGGRTHGRRRTSRTAISWRDAARAGEIRGVVRAAARSHSVGRGIAVVAAPGPAWAHGPAPGRPCHGEAGGTGAGGVVAASPRLDEANTDAEPVGEHPRGAEAPLLRAAHLRT
jgi:hypothetical protein